MPPGKIAIITDDPGWHGKVLTEAFTCHGFESQYASLTGCRLTIEKSSLPVIVPGFERQLPVAVFVRGVPGGSLEEVVFYLDILHALKMLGIPVYNDGRAIERSVDKAMTSFLLHQVGIPTPLTWVLRDRDIALDIAEQELNQGHFLVSKPLFGSQGNGIRRLEKSTDLFWLTDQGGIFYLQRFIHSMGEGCSDYRVFVINQRAIAVMRRKGRSWLNNVAQGAQCESVESNPEIANIAIKATQTLAMDYAGVDVIQDREGRLWVIEVNSVPAWRGLQSVAQTDIAQALADDLVGRHLDKIATGKLVAESPC